MPVVAALLLTEYLLVSGQASFSGALSLIGALLVPLLGGFFPILLLVASRRKGDVAPGVALRLVGHPLVVALIYLLYLASLFLYGLVIWQDPLPRAAALGVAFLGIAMPIVMVRRGAFRRQAVIELRAHRDGTQSAAFAVSAAGQPRCQADSGEIPDFDALRAAAFRCDPASKTGATGVPPPVRDLKVRTHALAPEGDDQALSATAEIRSGDVVAACDLDALGGQVVLPLADGGFAVEVACRGPSKDAC